MTRVVRACTPSSVTTDLSVVDHFRLLKSMGLPWWCGLLPGWAIRGRVDQAITERLGS